MPSATLRPSPSTPAAPKQDVALKLHRPAPVHLVVIVPALNEEHTIVDVIRRIPRTMQGVDEVSVVVVDDGSTDRTAKLARAEGALVVSHPRPCGVGCAFQSGLRKVFELGGDLVVNIDGDGQFSPEDIPKLIAPVLSGVADFATASRFKDPALVPHMPWIKKWGNRRVAQLISHLTGTTYHDVSCGMRAYGRDAALSLSLLEPFTYTHEVFLHLTSKRMKIAEVPLVVRGQRQYGKSRVANSVLRYGHNTLKIVFRAYRDYYPLRFFGWIAALCCAIGIPLVAFFCHHYLSSGSFAPHKWAGIVGGAFLGGALASLFTGVLGDMLNRQRVYLEEIQYHIRALVAADNRRGR
jgi:glycosyltransferase involved in cell wall biosynthesis